VLQNIVEMHVIVHFEVEIKTQINL